MSFNVDLILAADLAPEAEEVEEVEEATCPVTQLDFDIFATENSSYFELEAQLGIGWEVLSSQELFDLAVETFKLHDSDRYPCEQLTMNLVNDHSFLSYNRYAQTVELISSITDDVGIYVDSYLEMKMGALKLTLPIKVTIFSCELTKVGF